MSFWKNWTILQKGSVVKCHANVPAPEETGEQLDIQGLRVVQDYQEAKDILEKRVDLEREVLLVLMELRVSRDVLDREVSRALEGTQEKRVNLEKSGLMASMERRAKVEWLVLQETEETLEEEVLKVSKGKQETLERWESEETLEQVDKITIVQGLKETPVMPDQWESPERMEIREALVKSEEGEPMAEEVPLDRLEILEGQELMVCRESLVLEDLEVQLDQIVHQDPEEKMGTLDRGVLEEAQAPVERRVEEELLVVRESQETQDLRVSLDPLDPVESQVKMAEMGLVFQGLKEEKVTRDSQDSRDPREQLGIVAPRVDLDPEEIVDREVSLGLSVHPDRREKLDILDNMVSKDQGDQVSCNVTWSRRSETTAVSIINNAHVF
ncbi:golgin subfamily A member 6-like protein 1 isoform X2 [Acanthochromis polyacanthus]|uniref:golgin subfamily A member 6-like protein 1 isoform X2 n=1 Tax=Acanthochromis polyacanthus TaxID=80966 RepID=UPI0022345E55|nr:golgin subfamily A member 6-like protein 1 isoform X2 [Acanthochromis polyacanthus]